MTSSVGNLNMRVIPNVSGFSRGVTQGIARSSSAITRSTSKIGIAAGRSLTRGLNRGVTTGVSTAGRGATRAIGSSLRGLSSIGRNAGRSLTTGLHRATVGGIRTVGTTATRALGSSMRGISAIGTRVGSTLITSLRTTVMGGVAAIGASTTALLGTSLYKGVGRLTAIDDAEASMKGLGHTGVEIDRIMQGVNDAVTGTAFGIDAAAASAAQLSGVGVQVGRDLDRAMVLTADIAAQAGTSMDDVSSIMSQVASMGRLDLNSLNRLEDRAVGAAGALSRHLGVSIEQVREAATAGTIDFETFQTAMEKHIGGAAQQMGNTVRGSVANMGAALGRIGATLAGPFFDATPQVASAVGSMFDSVNKAIGPSMDRLATVVGPAAARLSGVIETTLAPAAGNAIGGLIERLTNTLSDPSTWARIGRGVDILRTVFSNVAGVASQLITEVRQFVPVITGQVLPVISRVSAVVQRLIPIVSGGLLDSFRALSPVLSNVGNLATTLLYALEPIVGALTGGLVYAVRVMAPSINSIINSLGWLVTGVANGSRGIELTIIGIVNRVDYLARAMARSLGPAADVIGRLAPVVGVTLVTAFDAFARVLPALGRLVSTLAVALEPLINSLANGLTGSLHNVSGVLAGVIGQLGGFLTNVIGVAGTLAPVVGRLLTGSFTELGPVLSSLGGLATTLLYALEPIANVLVGGILYALRTISPALSGVVDGFSNLVAGISGNSGNLMVVIVGVVDRITRVVGTVLDSLQPLGGVIARLAPIVGTTLVGAFDALTPVLPAIGRLISSLAVALEPFIGLLAGGLVSALQTAAPMLVQFIDGVARNLPGLVANVAPVIGGFVQALQPAGQALLGLVPVVGGALAGAFQALAPHLPAIADLLNRVAGGVATIVAGIAPLLPQLIEGLLPVLIEVGGQLVDGLLRAFEMIEPHLPRIVDAVIGLVGAFAGLLPVIIPAFLAFKSAGAAGGAIASIGGTLFNVGGAVATVGKAFRGASLGQALLTLMGAAKSANPIVAAISRTIGSIFKVAWRVAGGLKTLSQGFMRVVGAVGRFIKPIMTALRFVNPWVAGISLVVGALIWFFTQTELGQEIWGKFTDFLGKAIGWIGEQFEKFGAWVSDTMGSVVSFFVDLPGNIVEAVGDIWQRMKDLGSQIVQGIIDGITGMASKAGDAISGLVGGVVDGAKNLLGINSPSKVFIGIGEDTGDGLIGGLANRQSAVDREMARLLSLDGLNAADLTVNHRVRESALAGVGARSPETIRERDRGAGAVVNIHNPIAEPASETLRRNSAYLTGGY